MSITKDVLTPCSRLRCSTVRIVEISWTESQKFKSV